MKRLVYVTQRFPVLTETFTVKEIDGLRARGLEVDVYGLRPVAGDSSATVVDPRRARPRGLARAAAAVPPTGARRALAAARGAALARSLDARRDHVHVQFPLEASTAALAAAAASGASFSFSGHTYHRLELMPAKLRRALFVVVGSTFEVELLCRRYGEQWRDRIEVRRLGVPPRSRRAGDDGRTVVAVGSLTGKKGHAVLIRAIHVLTARGVDVRAEIVGGGPERAELESLARELGVEDRVALPGALPHDDALARTATAAVFALACRETPDGDHDCLPVALMDAMSLGTPCVSSDAFGIPELIEDGVSGLLAEPGDPVDVADRIEALLDDAALRERIGDAGRDAVRERYDLDRNVAALAELFASRL